MAYLNDLPNLRRVLEDYAKEAEEIYKYQVSLGGHNASRKLADTVTSQVKVGNTTFEVSLSLQDYWKYLEGGSKGDRHPDAEWPQHQPPTWAILKWINAKPIIPRPDDVTGKIPSPNSLAYLIARSIGEHGTEPFPALATTVEDLDRIYGEKIADALGEDIQDYLMLLFGQ